MIIGLFEFFKSSLTSVKATFWKSERLYWSLKDLFKVGFSFCFDASVLIFEADVFYFRL